MKYATLITQNNSQRFYQLDFNVSKTSGSPRTIKQLFEFEPLKFNPGYELAEDVSESINKICISDAHTHTERLVFPAFNVRNKETSEIYTDFRCDTIAGHWTFITNGGDDSFVYDDKVYIRYLKILNSR